MLISGRSLRGDEAKWPDFLFAVRLTRDYNISERIMMPQMLVADLSGEKQAVNRTLGSRDKLATVLALASGNGVDQLRNVTVAFNVGGNRYRIHVDDKGQFSVSGDESRADLGKSK